jgi:hypothetical protein
LKIIFEMEETIFNQSMVFEVVYMTAKKVPPLKEPEGEVCSGHSIMEVKKPGVAVICVLEEKGIEPGLLVIPVSICTIILVILAEVRWEGDGFM